MHCVQVWQRVQRRWKFAFASCLISGENVDDCLCFLPDKFFLDAVAVEANIFNGFSDLSLVILTGQFPGERRLTEAGLLETEAALKRKLGNDAGSRAWKRTRPAKIPEQPKLIEGSVRSFVEPRWEWDRKTGSWQDFGSRGMIIADNTGTLHPFRIDDWKSKADVRVNARVSFILKWRWNRQVAAEVVPTALGCNVYE